MSQADRETTKVILRELREGTPNTPERIALFARADAIQAKMMDAAIEAGWKEFERITYSPLPKQQGGYTPSRGAFEFAFRAGLAVLQNRASKHGGRFRGFSVGGGLSPGAGETPGGNMIQQMMDATGLELELIQVLRQLVAATELSHAVSGARLIGDESRAIQGARAVITKASRLRTDIEDDLL